MTQSVQKAGATTHLRGDFAFRKSPIVLAIGLAIFGSHAAVAAEPAASKAPSRDAGELAEVTVTGSRIQQAVGMTTPTPVAALSATELQAMAPASITQALTQLPQFSGVSATAENFGNLGAGGFFNSPGGGSLNLRGIGTKRTLTLLDGRRMVPATAYGGPDISMFPDQILARVETVTGGASAAYGTDAVSGVVNYILDTNFEGLRASAQTGFSDHGDGKNQKYSLSVGHALGEKAHVILSAGFQQQDDIVSYAGRDWYDGCGLMQNTTVPANVAAVSPATTPPTWNATTYQSANGGYSAAKPRLVPACNLHGTQLTYDGLVTVGAGANARQYDLMNGAAVPFYKTLPATGPAATSGVMSGGGGQNFNETDASLLSGSNRKTAFLYTDYDVSSNFTVYAQGMYGWQSLSTYGRTGDFNSAQLQNFTVFRDNAFLPPSLGAIMDAAGVTSASINRAGTREDWGVGSFENNSIQRVATVGFKSTISGGFLDGWAVDGYAQWGQNKLDAVQIQGMRLDRIYLATDAVVNPTTKSIQCRVTRTSGRVPDCVPLNIFGRGNASAAAIDWIKGYDNGVAVTTNPFIGYDAAGKPIYDDAYSYVGDEDKHRRLTTTQKIAEVSASGKLFTGWAGDINGALGFHWREEGIDQKVWDSQGNTAADPTYYPVWCPDNVAILLPNQAGYNARCAQQISRGIRPPGAIGVQGVPSNPYTNSVDTQFSNVPFIAGKFDVKEAFAETIVPIIKGQSWMQEMNLQLAGRWADYAGSGSIWSYKAGLDAAFTSEVRLRGTYSHDTRAANIAERFDRTGGFTAPINDPTNPAGWVNPTAVTTVSGGNPDVDPEEADTFTAGIVYRPNWLQGLAMSVDWMRVSLAGAIEQLPAQRVIDLCYQQGDQDQCARIVRDPATNYILFIPQLYQNLSKARVEAVDAEIGYSRSVTIFGGGERVSARLMGTRLLENSSTSSAGVKTDSTGSVLAQYFKTKVNLMLDYRNGPFNWNLQARYYGGGELNPLYNQTRTFNDGATHVVYDVADNTIGGSVYWDTRFGYTIPMGSGSLELFANVNNLFDRDPPLVLAENAAVQTGGGYDVIGRRYVMGVNVRF